MRVKSFLALLAGALSVLAFSPFNFSILLFFCYAALFWLWLDAASYRQSFFYGWAFGLGQFGAGVSWIYVSLNTFGNMAPALAGLAVILLVMGLALYPACVGVLQHLFRHCSPIVRLLAVIAPVWVLAEWVREWLFTGLPWLAAGYSQVGNALSGWAPIGGIYLVSLAAVLLAAAIVLMAKKNIIAALAVAVACLGASYPVSQLEWTQAENTTLKVKLVQGNVAIFDKWETSKTAGILKMYLDLSNSGAPADLVIWPEAAAPVLYSRLPPAFWQALDNAGAQRFMFGVVEQDDKVRRIYNTVVTTGPGGTAEFYRKIHLVPFGEYLPLKTLLEWLLEYLHIPMSDLSPYQGEQPPVMVDGIGLGVSVCYEDAFANVVRKDLPHAGILVNISEDAWFGNSLAPHQRLQMAQMRAMENGRTMIRVSNNGLSSIIGFDGEIQAIAPQFETYVLDGVAQVRSGATPFSSLGHLLSLSLLLAMLLAAAVSLLVVNHKSRLGGALKQE